MDAGRSSNNSALLIRRLGVRSASGSATLTLRERAVLTGGGDLDLPLVAGVSPSSSFSKMRSI